MNIGRVLGNTFKNVFSKHAFYLSLLSFVLFGIVSIALAGVTPQTMASTQLNPVFYAFAGIAGILYIALSIIVMIGVLRSLYHKELRSEHFAESLGFTGLNLIADGILSGIIILIGFILLIIPGFIAIVALSLSPLYVVIDQDNVIDAIKKSWEKTQGHWLQIFAVVFIVWAISLAINLLTAIPDIVAGFINGPAQYVIFAITTYISIYTSLLQTSTIVELYRELN